MLTEVEVRREVREEVRGVAELRGAAGGTEVQKVVGVLEGEEVAAEKE